MTFPKMSMYLADVGDDDRNARVIPMRRARPDMRRGSSKQLDSRRLIPAAFSGVKQRNRSGNCTFPTFVTVASVIWRSGIAARNRRRNHAGGAP